MPNTDRLIFTPNDVDLARSPLRASLKADTFTLGAFNPGLTRLPNGNLLMMVRVAEALREPIFDGKIHAIRWTPEGYVLDGYPTEGVNAKDPRKFIITPHHARVMALTSLSWLLPVELSADSRRVIDVHYDRAIAPTATYQMYGVEDARISRIDGRYYMTTCSVSPERHCTTLYTSRDGLDWRLKGIVLDHQNKDMVLFEGMVGGKFMALTRPLGDLYFAYPPDSPYLPGPAIQLAGSPDALHWKPLDAPGIRPRKGTAATMRIGGGAPPIRTAAGWLALYHGVEVQGLVGIYRTFWALLDAGDPSRILRLADENAILEPNPALTAPLADQMYISDVVFTTGIAAHEDHYILASGEADLACRITCLPQSMFA
ncbi:MAG TPA: glycosidase [Caulobacterales bacterium]|jgi:predicted GH43/DUF377 family glycosyl hydrolase|nr:glycosidase [Caulobacterales bacterium]